MSRLMLAALAALTLATPALAQSGDSAPEGEREPRRYRVGLGAQVVPSYPGANQVDVAPLWDISIARGDEPFAFESPDQSTGIALIRGSFEFGPALGIEGSRRREETGAGIDEVGLTVEAGAFASLWLGSSLRLRAEGRKGVNGHRALVGDVSADYVARDGDKWVFSLGPRIALSDSKYQRAYFGVTPSESAATGLAAYRPGGGIHSAGGAATFITQFSPRWGIYSYARYERLVGDAARSPLVRTRGSRDQLSGGLALTFTFGRGVR